MTKGYRTIIGLMSGTSHDGIDAAIVKIRGSGVGSRIRLIYHEHFNYESNQKNFIHKVINSAPGQSIGVKEICKLNFLVGEAFAKAAIKCSENSGVGLKSVDAIASHGQTICHMPPYKSQSGSTLQIGEAAVIAQMTGVKVVSDFRAADMAVGGHGAPLVPFVDYILFKGKTTRLVQNIGGIANVTVVTPELEDVFAFDTGPGNSLVDEAMRLLYGKDLDRDGAAAAKGRPDEKLIRSLLKHAYFLERPPKSTGKETFGASFVEKLMVPRRMKPEDLMSTFTHLTVQSIFDAYKRFILPEHIIREVIVSGGGTANCYMMELLKDVLKPIKVKTVDQFGIPSGAKEALSFAVLANETLSGNPSNLPKVTGARKKVTLGKLTMP